MNELQVILNILERNTRRLHRLQDEITVIEDEIGEATYELRKSIIEEDSQQHTKATGYDHVNCK